MLRMLKDSDRNEGEGVGVSLPDRPAPARDCFAAVLQGVEALAHRGAPARSTLALV